MLALIWLMIFPCIEGFCHAPSTFCSAYKLELNASWPLINGGVSMEITWGDELNICEEWMLRCDEPPSVFMQELAWWTRDKSQQGSPCQSADECPVDRWILLKSQRTAIVARWWNAQTHSPNSQPSKFPLSNLDARSCIGDSRLNDRHNACIIQNILQTTYHAPTRQCPTTASIPTSPADLDSK